MPRPRVYRAQAVVLKRSDLGEADRVVTLFTAEHGKLRAIAKGVRRTKSRSAGHLELFVMADVVLAVGRELDVITEATAHRAFRRVREDLDLATYAYYLAEITDVLTPDREEQREVFQALVEALSWLEEERDPRLVVVAFLLRVLGALGYQPELRECVQCRGPITPGNNSFSAFLGGVLCPDCGPREVRANPISDDVLKLLRNLQRSPVLVRLAVRPEVSRSAEAVLRGYAEQLVERQLRAPRLIARVQPAPPAATL